MSVHVHSPFMSSLNTSDHKRLRTATGVSRHSPEKSRTNADRIGRISPRNPYPRSAPSRAAVFVRVSAGAELSASGNKRNLLVRTQYQGIPIRTPSEISRMLSALTGANAKRALCSPLLARRLCSVATPVECEKLHHRRAGRRMATSFPSLLIHPTSHSSGSTHD